MIPDASISIEHEIGAIHLAAFADKQKLFIENKDLHFDLVNLSHNVSKKYQGNKFLGELNTEVSDQMDRGKAENLAIFNAGETLWFFISNSYLYCCFHSRFLKLRSNAYKERKSDYWVLHNFRFLYFDMAIIELFNAKETLVGPEFCKIFGEDGVRKCEILFDEHFPNIKIARDSITHNHDRAFGRHKKEQKSEPPFSRLIDDGFEYPGPEGIPVQVRIPPKNYQDFLNEFGDLIHARRSV